MKQYIVVLNNYGDYQEVPVFAKCIDDALEWAESEYGEEAIHNVRTRVLEQPTFNTGD